MRDANARPPSVSIIPHVEQLISGGLDARGGLVVIVDDESLYWGGHFSNLSRIGGALRHGTSMKVGRHGLNFDILVCPKSDSCLEVELWPPSDGRQFQAMPT